MIVKPLVTLWNVLQCTWNTLRLPKTLLKSPKTLLWTPWNVTKTTLNALELHGTPCNNMKRSTNPLKHSECPNPPGNHIKLPWNTPPCYKSAPQAPLNALEIPWMTWNDYKCTEIYLISLPETYLKPSKNSWNAAEIPQDLIRCETSRKTLNRSWKSPKTLPKPFKAFETIQILFLCIWKSHENPRNALQTFWNVLKAHYHNDHGTIIKTLVTLWNVIRIRTPWNTLKSPWDFLNAPLNSLKCS